jgi:Flp pilus assembly pilin Flp
MGKLLREFWRDERGYGTMEWAFVASVLTLGTVVGLLALWHSE